MIEVSAMELRLFDSLAAIPKSEWECLDHANFPFSEYEFLIALERSESVGARSGWIPYYLTLWHGEILQAAMYLYGKANSYGEYIFDWEWARAYQAHGVPYYPKLTSAVPFTPATGPKLLFRNTLLDRAPYGLRLIREAKAMREELPASSLHFLFIPEHEIASYLESGGLIRHSFQFHWMNHGYQNFDAFLASLKSRKRKAIVKERQKVSSLDLEISTLSGSQLNESHADLMYGFYLTTISKMGAIPYLNHAFFREVYRTFRHRIVMILASRGGEAIAATLNYRKGNALFGRYWGAAEEIPGLHFELCYYRTIEFAIKEGLTLFEAGAQGEHKLARGFIPRLTYSAHFIGHPAFESAIARFTEEEKQRIQDSLLSNQPYLPYRNDGEKEGN